MLVVCSYKNKPVYRVIVMDHYPYKSYSRLKEDKYISHSLIIFRGKRYYVKIMLFCELLGENTVIRK